MLFDRGLGEVFKKKKKTFSQHFIPTLRPVSRHFFSGSSGGFWRRIRSRYVQLEKVVEHARRGEHAGRQRTAQWRNRWRCVSQSGHELFLRRRRKGLSHTPILRITERLGLEIVAFTHCSFTWKIVTPWMPAARWLAYDVRQDHPSDHQKNVLKWFKDCRKNGQKRICLAGFPHGSSVSSYHRKSFWERKYLHFS